MKNYTIREILEKTQNMVLLENQKDYREKFATFIRLHTIRARAIDDGIHRNALPTNSMLVIADTGCGKSYVASELAEASGVNFISVDCSTLSRVGWKGVNLPSILLRAKENCRDREKFATSIVHFDEFDKLRYHHNSNTGSVEGNPQVNLLALFDGKVMLDGDNNGESIDTSRMSFVFSGAFAENDLKGIVKRRISPPKSIGFQDDSSAIDDSDILAHTTMADIIEYGIMSELCGRIKYICYMPPLVSSDYRTLVKGGDGSVAKKYDNLFETMGVKVDITDAACDVIAEVSSDDVLGARSIDPIVYGYFQRCMMDVEDDPTINKVILDVDESGEICVTYEHGDRVSVRYVEKLVKLRNGDFDVPDVDFYYHIKSEGDVYKLRDFAVKLYMITMKNNVKLISAFLDYAFYYLWKYCAESDCTLENVEKLAKSTEQGSDGLTSTFDTMHGTALKTYGATEEDRTHLSMLYEKYLDSHLGDPHAILVRAVREIRKNWYAYLGRTMD